MVKKGDTLVEVTIAIGIFSLIAIAVASVMNSSTAGAQLALETTLTREEIDTQAEAIRYIQNTYTSNKEDSTHPLTVLWKKITGNAVEAKNMNEEKLKEIVQYHPTSCSDLYNPDKPTYEYAFVLNPRQLNEPSAAAYTSIKNNSDMFSEASTYPRLVFNGNGSLVDNDFSQTGLYRAEGIYVIAVKDPESTKIVDVSGNTGRDEDDASKLSAYYDFYIRTCWYGSNNEQPSTISTVIRLHDSEIISELGSVKVNFHGTNLQPKAEPLHSLADSSLFKDGYIFKGWCDVEPTHSSDDEIDTCNGTTYHEGDVLINREGNTTKEYNLYPLWERLKYNIRYDSNGSSWSVDNLTCYGDEAEKCKVTTDTITRSGFAFKGWCSGSVTDSGVCNGTTYYGGERISIPDGFSATDRTLRLTAIWEVHNETITVKLTWGSSPGDLDSHVQGYKSNGTNFHAYYSNKIGNDIDGATIAQLDKDVTQGYGPETFTINTRGGRNYYYYVHCYSSCSIPTNATVVVTGDDFGERVFSSGQASGYGGYWNVFAYKDGQFVVRQTRTSSPEINY